MSCKCGATVKAGECAMGITRFQVNEIRPFRATRGRLAQCVPAEREPAVDTAASAYWRKTGRKRTALIRQDHRGRIAVGWAIAPGDDESRSPRR
jgi:hypothetical protein